MVIQITFTAVIGGPDSIWFSDPEAKDLSDHAILELIHEDITEFFTGEGGVWSVNRFLPDSLPTCWKAQGTWGEFLPIGQPDEQT